MLFNIYTIYNDTHLYNKMRESFRTAGFDDKHCSFYGYDNTVNNRYEPYQVMRETLASSRSEYNIYCHQDVLVDEGVTIDSLLQALQELNHSDKRWVIAGNAGVDLADQLVLNLTDPHGNFVFPRLPHKVISLDENFFVIKNDKCLAVSSGLSGFHFYGTDLCLNAYLKHRTAYVIDFRLAHLSGGNPTDQSFIDMKVNFINHWNKYFIYNHIKTTCTNIDLANNPYVTLLTKSYKLTCLLRLLRRLYYT